MLADIRELRRMREVAVELFGESELSRTLDAALSNGGTEDFEVPAERSSEPCRSS